MEYEVEAQEALELLEMVMVQVKVCIHKLVYLMTPRHTRRY